MTKETRKGVTIFETTVALAILAVVATTTVQTLVGVAGVRLASQQTMTAQQEAANLMERLFAISWSELTDETATSLQLSEEARRQLRGAKLTVSLADTNAEPSGKKIRIEISWLNRGGEPAKPVSLVAWRYRLENQ